MRILLLSVYALLVLLGSGQAGAAEVNKLRPFVTDGCSMWFDGTHRQPYLWRHCCVVHDLAYWQGGASQVRDQADQQLRACVSEVAGKAMGNYMYFFVSTGGSPLLPTAYRWGYGWNYLENGHPRGYQLPNPQEQLQLDALLPQAQQRVQEDARQHPAGQRQ